MIQFGGRLASLVDRCGPLHYALSTSSNQFSRVQCADNDSLWIDDFAVMPCSGALHFMTAVLHHKNTANVAPVTFKVYQASSGSLFVLKPRMTLTFPMTGGPQTLTLRNHTETVPVKAGDLIAVVVDSVDPYPVPADIDGSFTVSFLFRSWS